MEVTSASEQGVLIIWTIPKLQNEFHLSQCKERKKEKRKKNTVKTFYTLKKKRVISLNFYYHCRLMNLSMLGETTQLSNPTTYLDSQLDVM